ncbi:MAG: RNA-binding S4 domain-containing protein [Ruminococcaceae bacterium]|nr:RNA-binding S4 domain-containing protein [Oscillospiraceae bacterium]
MRLDKYLKVSRLIKRRTVAQEACAAGKVAVNSKVQKASYDVKVGDVIELTFGEKVLKIQVVSILEHVRKEDADAMYKPL